MWTSARQTMRFPHDSVVFLPSPPGCEYGALRAPSLPFPHLTELPDMAETTNFMVTTPSSSCNNTIAINNNTITAPNHNHSGLNGMVVQADGGTNTATSTILTVRMIMQGKEVGSIIGKKGDNIKKFREDSGAKINISDGSCPERIVTVTGSTENIQRAFGFICKKFEELLSVHQDLQNSPTTPQPPVTLRLVVPASQCGSLIGKQGSKIKEIRESTGASIQVASEMLPNSTERAVTVSGTADAITQCIKYVCGIMLESPPKGANLPYRPKPLLSPLFISGNQGFAMPSPVGHHLPGQEFPKGFPNHLPMAPAISLVQSPGNLVPGNLVPVNGLGPAGVNPQPLWPPSPIHPSCLSLGPHLQYSPRPANPGPHHPPALPAPGQQAQEMNIPNDLIGCIIGRGGQKINEIRQVSGANIKISNAEDGSSDRKVTITGSPECIHMAQYLISTSMELHKTLNLDPAAALPPVSTSLGAPLASLGAPHHPMAISLMKALPPPHPHHSMIGLNGMAPMLDPAAIAAPPPPTSLAVSQFSAAAPPFTATSPIVDRKALTTKMRLGLTATTAFKTAERSKFSPY